MRANLYENILRQNFLFVKPLIRNSYFKNSFWAILGSFISKGLNFLAITYAAKILGPKIFGEYNVIQTTVGLFGTVSGLGLGLAATKLIAEWKSKDKEKVGQMIGSLYSLALLISSIVALLFFLSSKWISITLLKEEQLVLMLQLTSIIVIFDAVNGVQNGVLAGFEAFKDITVINLIAGIISAPIMILGTIYFDLTGLTISLLFSRLITVLVTRFYLKEILNKFNVILKASIRLERLKPIFHISVPSFLSSMATSPVNWVSTTIFVNRPLGYIDLGTYNAANQLKQLVLFLPDSAGKISIPKLANAFGKANSKEFKKIVKITFLFNLLLSLVPSLFIFLSSFLFRDFIGARYSIDNSLILLILATSILIALTNALGYIFICSNLIWYDLYIRIFWGLALIIFLLFYGRYNGTIGYGCSFFGAYGLMFLLQMTVIALKLNIRKSN